ncbi:predicted protein [Naegleria gruberi]|uniref:Predicted protein n=1 Tax=Naegleria gruberi TaxID=5762 RepID=D2VG89_NAEGR|nr:uncharacterized protein NAEGRDRAFT_67894 [Naegleria gruberi]EFC44228.1 predicted protein [Naegleria gruberi]|eukprot:XP_002676972.1 predicted protein [Naegleria gruberi strain NEG-M]
MKPSSPTNDNTANTPTATFHHISSSNRKQVPRFRFLQGFPVTALIVVNGIRGQQISFMYPTEEHSIFQQQSDEVFTNIPVVPNNVNNNPSNTITVNTNNNQSEQINPQATPSTVSLSTSIGNNVTQPIPTNITTTQSSQQHLVSHPQVIDRYENAFGLNSAALSYLLCPPKSSIINKSMSMTIDKLLFLSRPSSIQVRKIQLSSFNISSPSVMESAGGDYTHFTIAFVFPNHVLEEYNEKLFSHLLMLLMKSYVREQQRCGYVLDQLNLLGKLKDQAKNWRDLVLKACDSSLLAKELITIVDSIRSANPLQLRINSWIEFGFKTPKRLHHAYERKLAHLHDYLSKNKSPVHNECNREKVRAYNSCIFVNDLPKLKVPFDGLQELQGNDSILRLFNTATKTIGEIAKENNLNLSFVLALVQHLVDWGLVRIIPKISYSTVLTLNEHPDNSEDGFSKCSKHDWFPPPDHVIHEFSKRFPHFPNLIEVLEIFSTTKTCRSHIENIAKIQSYLSGKPSPYLENSPTTYFPSELKTSKKKTPTSSSSSAVANSEQYMMSIVWLLRKGYIRVCNTYYQLIIPQHQKGAFMRIPGGGRDMLSNSPSTPPHNIGLSPSNHQNATNIIRDDYDDVSSVSSTDSSPQSTPFKKYFNVKIPLSAGNELCEEDDSQPTFKSLSAFDLDYVKSLSDDSHTLDLFKKLHIYFNGEYSEREIIHQNNISREDLKKLVKTFNEIILTYTI